MLDKAIYPKRDTKAMKAAAIAEALKATGIRMKDDMADAWCIAEWLRLSYEAGTELEVIG